MGGACREGTKQEQIIDAIFRELRNLDKSTWNFYDRVAMYGGDLIEDAEYIVSRLQDYINEIKNQMSKKEKVNPPQ